MRTLFIDSPLISLSILLPDDASLQKLFVPSEHGAKMRFSLSLENVQDIFAFEVTVPEKSCEEISKLLMMGLPVEAKGKGKERVRVMMENMDVGLN